MRLSFFKSIHLKCSSVKQIFFYFLKGKGEGTFHFVCKYKLHCLQCCFPHLKCSTLTWCEGGKKKKSEKNLSSNDRLTDTEIVIVFIEVWGILLCFQENKNVRTFSWFISYAPEIFFLHYLYDLKVFNLIQRYESCLALDDILWPFSK